MLDNKLGRRLGMLGNRRFEDGGGRGRLGMVNRFLLGRRLGLGLLTRGELSLLLVLSQPVLSLRLNRGLTLLCQHRWPLVGTQHTGLLTLGSTRLLRHRHRPLGPRGTLRLERASSTRGPGLHEL